LILFFAVRDVIPSHPRTGNGKIPFADIMAGDIFLTKCISAAILDYSITNICLVDYEIKRDVGADMPWRVQN
jgi:hypothetical protein